MSEHLLTLNAGSSSVKYALFACDRAPGAPLLSGQIDGLDQGERLDLNPAAAPAEATLTHAQALARVIERIGDARVRAVGHRIVHGGLAFDQPVAIDDAVLVTIEALAPLAPLHQPHNLAGVRAARVAFPKVAQIACFDTAFHRSMPERNQRFALPRAQHDQGLRRYGFHGLSYESIAAQLTQREPGGGRWTAGRTVVAHLGNGASMCALLNGRSVATTMSFSPLDGLPMGTRCGRLDAAVVLHLMQQPGMDAGRVARLLYRESGLLGLSGLSGDMRELLASSEPAAAEAIDYFVEHAGRELAGMAAALQGIDTLVFTGGIGEHASAIRQRIVQGCAWMGLRLDAQANDAGQERISSPDSAVDVLVLHTDEEAVIARHVMRLLVTV
jgi:acetate kinase